MADELQRYYANVVRLSGAAFDITLDFGFETSAESETSWDARVTMSWEHARVLTAFLSQALQNYEKAAGTPIRDVTKIPAAEEVSDDAGDTDTTE